MIRKIGILCIVLGIAALLAAAGLLYYNNWESQSAMEASNSVLVQMRQQEVAGQKDEVHRNNLATQESGTYYYEWQTEQEQLDETVESTENPYADHVDTFDEAAKEMTVVEIGGYDFIGYLSVPVLKLELPVMSEWDYQRLRRAPCRQFGSTKTDDLVIAAHNYPSHFGRFSQLRSGDLLTFTDMDSVVILYEVVAIDVLEPTASDAVRYSGFELVLYTCTYGGESRVVVFCDRVKK